MLVVMTLRPGSALVVVVALVAAACSGTGTRRAVAPTTSMALARAPAATTTTSVAPSRVMPWISTTVAPNARDTFARTLDAAGVHNAPSCRLPALLVKASINGGLGTQYLGVRVQNRSQAPCVVEGSAYLRLLDLRGRSLDELLPQRSARDRPVTLVPTSWAVIYGIAVASSVCGTNIAAITFGLDRNATRTVATNDTRPTIHGCGPSPGLTENRAFEPLYGAGSDTLMFAALRDGAVRNLPRAVRRGGTLAYSVTITNTDPNTLPLVTDDIDGVLDGNCPIYQQSLGAFAPSPLLLNCDTSGLLIAPGTAVRFEMRINVPADQPLGRTTLRWQFKEPEEPLLSAPVLILERA
jgi:hypothetical protein